MSKVRGEADGESGRVGEWENGRVGESHPIAPSRHHPLPLVPHSPDPFIRGSEYLSALRQLALAPGAIDITDDINDRIRICSWIGHNIDAINAELNACLEACRNCFHPHERRVAQIFAAPLAEKLGVDAFCNILLDPIAIFIDVGRIEQPDWLGVVAHEYAHAHLGTPGHDQRFLAAIAHLCLGLGLEPPVWEPSREWPDREALLRNWPYCGARPNPLAFWMGGV